jgi:hypothetical protein
MNFNIERHLYSWWGIGAVALGLLGLLFWAAEAESAAWEAFAQEHHCRLVGHINGSVAPSFGIGSSGLSVFGTTPIPAKDGFACDDGVTYWR